MAVRRSIAGVALVLIVLGIPVLADDAPVRYDNYRLVRIYASSWDQIEQIHAAGGRLWSCNEGPGLVDYYVAPEDFLALQQLGLPLKVLNENIQRSIDAERAAIERQTAAGPRDPNWFLAYKNLDQINLKLNTMVTDRPDLVTLIDIGTTLQGRHIYGVRITGPGENKPAVLFDATHHAREWITPMTAMWIADKLVYDYDTDPTIQTLVNAIEFFVIPVVNCDGYVYSWQTDRMWRKNRRLNSGGCYGVDPNRNYGAGWGGSGSSGDPCSETYRGTAAFSEPEVAAIRDFFISHPQIVSMHDYHSYSQLVMSPYGYTSSLPADHDVFIELDEAMADAIYAVHGMVYAFGPIYSTIYPVGGGSIDWLYDNDDVFAFTSELRDTGTYGFELPADQIIPTAEENFAAVLVLAQWSMSPIKISFPNGLPQRLTPQQPETFKVKIKVIGATLDPASPMLLTRTSTSGPFTEIPLTSLGNELYDATLPATWCGLTRQFYISAATTTGQSATSPPDAPNTTYQATAQPVVTILDKNMDTDPVWTKQGLWNWGTPTGGGGEYGGPDPTSGFTGTKVYGYNLNGDYENNLSERHVTSSAINCSNMTGVRLSFYRWLGVEQAVYDHAYVRVSNNGTTYTTIWQNSATLYDGAWVYQEFDISAVADNKPNVYLRWTMGTTDGGWRYCGWNVDDVKVWANDPDGCPAQPGDMNCDGSVGFPDINPFVQYVTSCSAWQAAYPNCPAEVGDIDGDGQHACNGYPFDDINAFVALLTQ